MKKVLSVLVVSVFMTGMAFGQITTWLGTGDADPLVVLGRDWLGGTVVATAAGYEFTAVGSWATGGLGGAAALTGITGDFIYTVELGDMDTAEAGGSWVLQGIFAGPPPVAYPWDDPAIAPMFIEGSGTPGDFNLEGEAVIAGPGGVSVSGTGTVTMRYSRSGDTLTAEYTLPGSGTFVEYNTGTLAGAVELGVMVMTSAGTETVLVESVTLEIPAAGPVPASVDSFDRDTAIDEPFTGGTAAWTITFSEGVDNVDAVQFTVTGNGVTFTGGPTITSGADGDSIFGVEVTGVGVGPGSLTASFNPLLAGGVTTTAGGEPVVDTASSTYSNVPVAPTATSWVLVFLGLVLALATAITLRKKAISN